MFNLNFQSRKLTILLFGLTAWFIICALVLTVLVLVFDKLFLSLLYQDIIYLPGRRLFENWRNPTVPILFKVHLFNVTNVEDILLGGKPRVEEVGPFVYREIRVIRKIIFSKEDPPETLDFIEEKHYIFQPQLSVADPATLNVTIPDLYFSEQSVLGKAVRFALRNQSPFVTLNAYSAIWETKLPGSFSDTIKVGIFSGKNDTKPTQIRMRTGAYDVNNAGEIVASNGFRIQTVWDSEEANLPHGIQGVRLPPSIQLGSSVKMYLPELCRAVTLTAMEAASSSILPELKLMKFTAPEANELDSRNHWTNRMHCKYDGPCTPKGFLSLEACVAQIGHKIPIYLSFPYFMEADTRVTERIDGVPKSVKEKHRIYLLAEPTTGLTLEAYLRFQLNLFMANTHERHKNMSGPFYFPLAWIELEIVTPLGPVKLLKEIIIGMRQNAPYVMSILAVVCGILSLLLLVTVLVRIRFYRTHGSVTLTLKLHSADDLSEWSKEDNIDFRGYQKFPQSDSKEVLQTASESDQLSERDGE